MHFPVYLHIGPWSLHPHVLFEALAYTVGFRIYLAYKKKQGDVVEQSQRWWVITAAAMGAAIGSRVLFWFENPALTAQHWNEIPYLLSGKTIVGGLLGGLIAVETVKKILGVKTATGDLFAVPLCVGMAIGRIGCFLTGLSDDTCGVATSLPWGVDFGDGVRRHPVQIYEIILLLTLAFLLATFADRLHENGDVFKLFLSGYLLMRLVIDWIKPEVHVVPGLGSIQLACIAGLIYYSPHLIRIWQSRKALRGMSAGA